MWETGVGEVVYLGHWQTTPALSAIKDCGVNASTKHRTGTIAFLLNHYERMSPSGAPFFKCDPTIGHWRSAEVLTTRILYSMIHAHDISLELIASERNQR